MRHTLSIVLLSSLVATSFACTTTSTVGENPDDKQSGVGGGDGTGTNPPPSSTGSSTPAPAPAPAPSPTKLDTKGVVSVAVSARYYLGQVNPITGKQDDGTAIRVALRNADLDESYPTGTPGTCLSKPNGGAQRPDYDLNIPVSITVTAGGQVKATQYDAQYKSASTGFWPPLPDGTPITLTFGNEVPALAGKSVTLPAVTTSLSLPARKPNSVSRDVRGYTPGTDFTMTWASMPGKKFFLAADAHVQPLNVVNCFLADTDTSLTVPASYMDVVTNGADPATQFPPVFLTSRIDDLEEINGIKVRKSSSAELFFQLNLAP